jgi:hypothetical protein
MSLKNGLFLCDFFLQFFVHHCKLKYYEVIFFYII